MKTKIGMKDLTEKKKRFKNNRKFKSGDRSDQFKDKNFKEKNQNGFKNKKIKI